MTYDPKTLPEDAVVRCVVRGDPHYVHATCRPVAVYVSIPDGVAVEDAAKALAALHPDRRTEVAIEEAVSDGGWNGQMVLANLRAAGFDVVKADA